MKKVLKSKNIFRSLSPAALIVVAFLIAVMAGTALLIMPFSTKASGSIGFSNALFTATSAVCVTGLVIADTASTWSAFGQTIVLILIQIGGLGIMTAASTFSLILGRNIGLKERLTIQESLNEFSLQGVVKLFRYIIIATFSIEAIGSLLLATRFIPEFGFFSGLAKSIFHSISAFCNAGFDIMGTASAPFVSITNFNNDFIVVMTIGLLFVIGGFGFVVWKDIISVRKFKDFMLHTKVVIIMTAILIISGMILFFIFEYSNTMEGMGFFQRLYNSFFHAVTPRTAGFNTLPVDKMLPQSQFLTMILMFIGAAPGSTGGGIKITTFTIVIFAIITYMKSSDEVNILKRKVNPVIVRKSLSIFFVALALVFFTTFVLLLSDAGTFKECIFEAVSAFGTVGLSTGITPSLPLAGKIMITITMFVGRVSPLALALSLTQLSPKKPYSYPEGKIAVG
ncbi:MAG: Trk family potassium uptake protein [Clostridiales bacterium]|nr:Trk family potassium uptake protein [Clostridiales bacterium]